MTTGRLYFDYIILIIIIIVEIMVTSSIDPIHKANGHSVVSNSWPFCLAPADVLADVLVSSILAMGRQYTIRLGIGLVAILNSICTMYW